MIRMDGRFKMFLNRQFALGVFVKTYYNPLNSINLYFGLFSHVINA